MASPDGVRITEAGGLVEWQHISAGPYKILWYQAPDEVAAFQLFREILGRAHSIQFEVSLDDEQVLQLVEVLGGPELRAEIEQEQWADQTWESEGGSYR